MNNQSAVNKQVVGQENTNKKEMVSMTNKAIGFQLVNSKEVVSAADRSKQVFPVQVKMEIQVGAKSQNVTFGYSRLGGRQTYVLVEGKAPINMSRADFVKVLQGKQIVNMKQVQAALSKLRYFSHDGFVVAKCECCDKYVTAANVDFMQRNHEKLSEKLGRKLSQHSLLCYSCQGAEYVKKPQIKKPAPNNTPATQHTSCADCGKEIKSASVVKYSVKQFGRPLCYKPCQGNQPSPDRVGKAGSTAPTPKEDTTPQEGTAMQFSFALMEEIMALDVDRFSEIAKLQDALRGEYDSARAELNSGWGGLLATQQEQARVAEQNASAASVTPEVQQPEEASAASSPEAIYHCEGCQRELMEGELCDCGGRRIVNLVDACFICDSDISKTLEINENFCTHCIVGYADRGEADLIGFGPMTIAESRAYIEAQWNNSGASAASPLSSEGGLMMGESQEQAMDEEAETGSDTQEVPQESGSSGADHSDPTSTAGSNETAHTAYMNASMDFYEEVDLARAYGDVPPMTDETVPF